MHCFHAFIFFPPKVQLFLFFPQNIVLCKIKIKKQEIQNHCGPMKTNDRKCRGGLQICHYGILYCELCKTTCPKQQSTGVGFLVFLPKSLTKAFAALFSPEIQHPLLLSSERQTEQSISCDYMNVIRLFGLPDSNYQLS